MAKEKVKEVQSPEDLLSKPWRKFLDKLKESKPEKIHKWEPIHLLSYNLECFKRVYGLDYSLSFAGPPSKCTEIVLTKRLFSVLNTTNPVLVKEYLDWAWKNKVEGKTRIRNISFFNNAGVANEFKFFWKEKNKVTKTSSLPQDCLDIIADLNLPIQTYGDLIFVKAVLEADSTSPENQVYAEAMKRLYSIGFEDHVLANL